MRHLHHLTFPAAALLLAACSGDGLGLTGDNGDAGSPDSGGPTITADGGADSGDNGGPSTNYPAPHPPPPQVLSAGGPVLLSPRIVPVFFSNDDPGIKAQVKDFLSKIGSTNYWKAATEEYDGIGPATSTDAVELTEAAPAMVFDTDIPTWLAAKLNANDPAFPAADEDTVYMLHYPAGTTISSGAMGGRGQTSCQDYGGYHADLLLDARHSNLAVAYAVIPRCPNFGNLTGLDAVTSTESHELIEAATDPYPMYDPAYDQLDDDHYYWSRTLGGAETGDMCAQDPNAFTRFPELPYVVQRSWSNKSALAGHDPCVPTLPNVVYFNAAPELNDTLMLMSRGQTRMVKGAQIPVGSTKTINLDLFSDGNTGGPFTVRAEDATALFGGAATLQLSLDRTSGVNGEKLHLTIKTVTASTRKSHTFMITTKHGGLSNYWFGIVGE